jgi:hypothetical protein
VPRQDEERLLSRFLSTEAPRSLGELIFQRIQEAEAAKASADAESGPEETITPKVVEVFKKVPSQQPCVSLGAVVFLNVCVCVCVCVCVWC